MDWTREAEQKISILPDEIKDKVMDSIEKIANKQNKDKIDTEIIERAKKEFLGKKQERKTNSKKIAIIRCQITAETCPGVGCLNAFRNKRVYFEDYNEEVKLVGFFTCGGCPGRRISRLLKNLEKHDEAPEVVHLSSCMLYDEKQEYVKCPHLDSIKSMIKEKGYEVIEGTHH